MMKGEIQKQWKQYKTVKFHNIYVRILLCFDFFSKLILIKLVPVFLLRPK